MTVKLFYQTQKDLWRAKGYFSPKTGVAVQLTLAEKAVYMYMEDRISFFVQKRDGEYFETHETIAEAVGIERKACGKIVRKFVEEGVISAVKRKPKMGGQLQWFYSAIVTDLKFWVGTIEHPTALCLTQVVKSRSVDHKQRLSVPKLNSFGEDESDCPF